MSSSNPQASNYKITADKIFLLEFPAAGNCQALERYQYEWAPEYLEEDNDISHNQSGQGYYHDFSHRHLLVSQMISPLLPRHAVSYLK